MIIRIITTAISIVALLALLYVRRELRKNRGL
jgi:hypothetical protein